MVRARGSLNADQVLRWLTQALLIVSPLIVLYLVLAAMKWIFNGDVTFDRQYIVQGIGQGSVYGALALALVLIYRSTDVINFAQGEMAMFCTFISWALITQAHWGWYAALIGTLVFSALFGAIIQRVVITPIENAPLLTIVIVTLGLFQVVNSFAIFIWQAQPKSIVAPYAKVGAKSVSVFGASVGRTYVGALAITLIVMGLVYVFFNYTKLGLASRASAQNPVASRLCGVPVGIMLTIGWALAAMVGATAGVVAAPISGLDPTFMQGLLLYAFAAAVLGGLDSPVGAVLGGFLIGIIQNVVGGSALLKDIKDPVAFIVILIVLMVRPTGLLGSKTVKKV
ncbi:MAG TPA: branched-chain amino acid ABC transporter permease [Dehalococcoidia bacterium]|nr:branched-chain amino acid ABC transporter permease [Dehalococcoidia bacterium]